jgi:PTH2 family peptidyl-tRNA hydrolase
MPPGKLAAQAGHAFVGTIELCRKIDPGRLDEYNNGTKVTIGANNLSILLQVYNKCREENIPCYLVEDAHHILPPHFDGNPIITALGIGPVTRQEIHHITKKFQIVK